MTTQTLMSTRLLARVGWALLALAFTGCPLVAPWDDLERPGAVARPYGTLGSPPAADGGSDSGVEEKLPPHPATCGERRGLGDRSNDLLASCPLPADADAVAAGSLPANAAVPPDLILGDEVLTAAPGGATLAFQDLYRQKPGLQLALAGSYVAGSALATDTLICAIVRQPRFSLQCFDRTTHGQRFLSQIPNAGSTLTVGDIVIGADTFWIAYAVGIGPGTTVLAAFNLANGQVRWSAQLGLGTSGRMVLLGDALVGYDQTCDELGGGSCLRAVNGLSGTKLAPKAALYQKLIWRTPTKAVFAGFGDWYEYDAAAHIFRSVTTELQPFRQAVGTEDGYTSVAEPLPDGRALLTATFTNPGTTQHLLVVDPVSHVFRDLGTAPTSALRLHGDLLVHEGGVISLSGATVATVTPRLWFGIFGFNRNQTAFSRRER